jgi:hypothetical protein
LGHDWITSSGSTGFNPCAQASTWVGRVDFTNYVLTIWLADASV